MKRNYNSVISFTDILLSHWYKNIIEPFVRKKNAKKRNRFLEIGPGETKILGFETVNFVKNKVTDYVCDASKQLPFADNSFDIVYASHILEHIPWYQTEQVLKEWIRILKPNGILELWIPDGLKIAKAFVDAEISNSDDFYKDGWYRFNEQKDPCIWAAGRIFSYGDGLGTKGHHNWHYALFSERYLQQLLTKCGMKNIEKMTNDKCRGYDHGWINLGMKASK